MLAKAGKVKNCMIEGMGCPGGCMAGAGTIAPLKDSAAALKKYVASSERKLPPKELEDIQLD